jgi:hypothetical protein
MAANNSLAPDVEKFIRDHITSVEELEVLLLLHASGSKSWRAAEVSQQLYRQVDSVSARLETLRGVGLLIASGETPPSYRYDSQCNQDATVTALEQAYRERKDTVIRLIFETPRDHLRIFSDAFKFGRRD